jgi:membrane protein YqaA with SNARE-associated domain
MLEFLWSISHKLTFLVREYGLGGLLVSSFIGSTIFVPFSTELAIIALASAGVNKFAILVAATVGSVSGCLVNYYIGFAGMTAMQKYISKKDEETAHDLMNRYGWVGLLVALAIPVSLPVDPLTILCGSTKMHLGLFVLVVTLGKALKYALVLGLMSVLFG